MKKKLFLGLIPAIMALSACAGAALPNNEEQSNLFKEDTLIHEELFEQAASKLVNKEIQKLPYVDETGPLIGVQKSITYKHQVDGNAIDVVALRFVAAINLDGKELSDVKIVWDRAVYTDGGSVHNNIIGEKQVEKVYTTIYDGEGTISAPTGYTHFVTYTLRNVPVANANYVVAASLSIDGVSNNKVCASSIDLTRQVSFDKDTTGFFLAGSFDGNAIGKSYSRIRGSGDHAAFIAKMKAGDGFLTVNRGENYLRVYPHTQLADGNAFFTEDGERNKIVAKNDGEYIFFLSKGENTYDVLFAGEFSSYIVGAEYGWENANGTRLYYDYETDTCIGTYTSNEDADRRIGVRICSNGGQLDEDRGWSRNSDTWLNCGFSWSQDGNILISAAGTYTVRLYLNDTRNSVGFEKEGVNPRMSGTNLYLVGTPTIAHNTAGDGFGEPTDNTFLFVNSLTEGYRCELLNISMKKDDVFKVKTFGTWNNERWQWDCYYLNGNPAMDIGSPDGLTQENTENNRYYFDAEDWTNWNIKCKVDGKYDLLIKSNNKLEIRLSTSSNE